MTDGRLLVEVRLPSYTTTPDANLLLASTASVSAKSPAERSQWSGYQATVGGKAYTFQIKVSGTAGRTAGPMIQAGEPPYCYADILVPSGTYDPNTGYLSAYVDGQAYCNFTTSSLAATISFAGQTGSTNIWDVGQTSTCRNCGHSSWIQATYAAYAPCGSTYYDHYGVVDVFWTMPNGTRDSVIAYGPSNEGTVWNSC